MGMCPWHVIVVMAKLMWFSKDYTKETDNNQNNEPYWYIQNDIAAKKQPDYHLSYQYQFATRGLSNSIWKQVYHK